MVRDPQIIDLLLTGPEIIVLEDCMDPTSPEVVVAVSAYK